jgi:hypothetical protein
MGSTSLLNASINGYRLVDFLGAGGMGEVYRAVHARLDRVVAIKALPRGDHSPEFLRRFENEARLHATLHHPNIATLFDFFEYDGRACIVMEYVDGRSLADLLRERGPLPVREAVPILRDVVSAIVYVHAKGIVHRDIKPENIRISSAGFVKVLDFGIAKAEHAPGLTQAGNVVGTPQYLSPEQLLTGRASPQSDIWALGIVFYEMMTGRVPFEGQFVGQIWKQIDTGTYRRLAETVAPESAAEASELRRVDRVVARCLKKNLADRYESAAQLFNDVSALAGPATPEAPRPVVTSRTAEPVRAALVRAREAGAAVQRHLRLALNGRRRLHALDVLERRWMMLAIVALVVVLLGIATGRRPLQPGPVVSPRNTAPYQINVVGGRADVYLNGKYRGPTPHTYYAAPGEVVDLELRQPGYTTWHDQFDITRQGAWHFSMQRASEKE